MLKLNGAPSSFHASFAMYAEELRITICGIAAQSGADPAKYLTEFQAKDRDFQIMH